MEESGHNFVRLKQHVLRLSRSDDWQLARREWSLIGIYDADEPETCPCGHHPIMEICVIRNSVTHHQTEVGNHCVRRFLGIRSDLVFTALKRIRADRTKSLNEDAIIFFQERGFWTPWEFGFLQNTFRKRALSPAQENTRVKINNRVLEAVQKRGFRG